VSQAAWTLLGVAVGALISGGTQVLLDWRKDKSEARKEAAETRAEIRVVARLVADEVDTLGFQMKELAERGRSFKTPFSQRPHYLPVDEWRKGKAVLAGVVADDVWSDLTSLYTVPTPFEPGSPQSHQIHRWSNTESTCSRTASSALRDSRRGSRA
jgi:hypothetical protein